MSHVPTDAGRRLGLTISMLALLAACYREGGLLFLEAYGPCDGHPMSYRAPNGETFHFQTIRSWGMRRLIKWTSAGKREAGHEITVTLTKEGVELSAYLADAFAGWYDAGKVSA